MVAESNYAEAIEPASPPQPPPPPSVFGTTVKNAAEIPTTAEEDRIYQLTSGLQFRNIRIGSGPPISTRRTYDEPIPLHLRAATTDGVLLFDTRLERRTRGKGGGGTGGVELRRATGGDAGGGGTPILYTLGTAQDFDTFGGDSSARGRVTQGVEDTILSRGLLAEWNGGADESLESVRQAIEPMREGGVRRVLVPSALAYGNSGVSRYDAFEMGLMKPVPRDQMIVYEVELLRCLSVELEVPGDATEVRMQSVQACCTEENYPCNTPTQQR